MLQSDLFNVPNSDTYPPFKQGLYLEEYVYNKLLTTVTKRKYIPVKWTNFQIESWFPSKKQEMQLLLDEWISENPCEHGYFTVVQYDDGPLLQLPPNTKVYGACSGDVPIPLIYEDTRHTLERVSRKSFQEKDIFCSFIGNITSNHVTPNVRQEMFKVLNDPFMMIDSGGWSPVVNQSLQELFIETTSNSKFSLAPRGYGRSSFRFFECFQLGTIPIYIWNDMNWLPFQKQIDYTKLCVVIHVSELDQLVQILLSIGEAEYNHMLHYYEEIKHLFQMEGMTNEILKDENVYCFGI